MGYEGDLEPSRSMYEYWNNLRNCQKQELTRPDTDVKIPYFIEKAGKGTFMYIPVTVHGKEYKFILIPEQRELL